MSLDLSETLLDLFLMLSSFTLAVLSFDSDPGLCS